MPSFQDDRTPDAKERCSEDSRNRKDEVRSRGDQSRCSTSSKSDDSEKGDGNQDAASSGSSLEKEKALKQLKLDMEENKFCYIAPRFMIKRRDYLHYARRRKDVLIYAVHADYYILLRCCAKVGLVETRIMHIAVLSLERRLQWLEKRIDHSLLLHSNIDGACEFCEGEDVAVNDSNI